MAAEPIAAVLFDLDGTFADTAPDLGRALNRMRSERSLPPLPLAATRPLTSSGARGMLAAGFGLKPGDPEYPAMRDRFLDYYADCLCVDTRLFEGIEELVGTLESRGLCWGIVTNKPKRFTEPLAERLRLHGRAACVVSGDTTARTKPHPEPLLHAASVIGKDPRTCIYVGDDLRDVQAARAAAMPALAAGWGYLGEGGDPHAWGADAVLGHPLETLGFLDRRAA